MPTSIPAWAAPAMAVQILTRVPVPWTCRLSPEQVRHASAAALRWLPLVGGLIGAFTATIFVLAGHIWPPLVAALFAISAEALLTGAFHEDAVADYCDAFGGGQTAEDVKRILKDSRVGSYGVLGLVLAVALRATATAALPEHLTFLAIVGAATSARLTAVALTAIAPPATTAGLAASVSGPDRQSILSAVLLAVPGFAWICWTSPWRTAAALAATLLLLFLVKRQVMRRIGGYTGDCLGFAAYVGQLVFLLVFAAR